MKNLDIKMDLDRDIKVLNENYNGKSELFFEVMSAVLEIGTIVAISSLIGAVGVIGIPTFSICGALYAGIRALVIKEHMKDYKKQYNKTREKAYDEISNLRYILEKENIYTTPARILNAKEEIENSLSNSNKLYRINDLSNNTFYINEKNNEMNLIDNQEYETEKVKVLKI